MNRLICSFALIAAAAFTSSAARADELHENWLEFLAAEWHFVVTDADGTEAIKGTVVFKRTGDTPALTLNAQGNDFSLLAVSGWHNERKMFVETGYVGEGRYIREFTKVSDKELVGVHKGRSANGEAVEHDIRYVRTGGDSMKLIGDNWVVTFSRQKPTGNKTKP